MTGESDRQGPTELLRAALVIAEAAGEAILARSAESVQQRAKADGSPVTDADLAAEAIILDRLTRLSPALPILSEESAAGWLAPASGPYWIVDPLDGTRGFLEGRDEYTVNIALVEAGAAVLGVVHAPARRESYWGGPSGAFARLGDAPAHSIHCRPASTLLKVVTSRSHDDPARIRQYLTRFSVAEIRPIGSAVKFGMVAAGLADFYLRLGPTMEWDTAAGQAVLEAAGGTVSSLDGGVLRYGKADARNGPFIARGPAAGGAGKS
jgi:3'(2'), 5'-bisphosphate nucleotidase